MAHSPKDSSRVRGDARARREQRQQEAVERAVEAAARMPEDQLFLLDSRRGDSSKERDKLIRQIEERKVGGA